MIELTDTKLKRPMDPAQRGTEVAALKALIADLNNPKLTGAEPPDAPSKPQVALPGQEILDRRGATLMPVDPVITGLPRASAPVVPAPAPAAPAPPPSAAPAPAVAPVDYSRLILTGRSGCGKTYLVAELKRHVQDGGAIVARELYETILDGVRTMCPLSDTEVEPLLPLLRAWADGEISANYPMTPARILFLAAMRARTGLQDFGTPDFTMTRFMEVTSKVGDIGRIIQVVTRVENEKDLIRLRQAGWIHFHVMCTESALKARSVRANADNRVAIALDRDATMRSNSPDTIQVRCVWNDVAPVPHNLYSVDRFLAEVCAPRPSAIAIE